MNWFKPKTWKKIGEVECDGRTLSRYTYCRFAIMECVLSNGDRKYKRVFMCGWNYIGPAKLECGAEDPLKEINEILRH